MLTWCRGLTILGLAAATWGWCDEGGATPEPPDPLPAAESLPPQDREAPPVAVSEPPTNSQPIAIDGNLQGLQKPPAKPTPVPSEGEAPTPAEVDRKAIEGDTPQPEKEHFVVWSGHWRHGYQYELRQKTFLNEYAHWVHQDSYRKLVGRLGAKVHIDAAQFEESGDIPPIDDGAYLRRARLYTLGNTYLFRPLDYRVEFGYSDGAWFFSEGYLRWNELDWIQTLQIGQFKAPMSLEMMSSSGATTFMERGSPVWAFAPGNRLGFQIGGPFARERMTLVVGGYANVADLNVGDATESAAGPMGRFTWSPLYGETDGVTKLLHVGGSMSYTTSRDNAFRYRSRPESYGAPYLVDTDDMLAESATLYGIEAAGVAGPLSLQGEFLQSAVRGDAHTDATFRGAYAYVSWFLTGESRPYNANKGIFARIQPNQPLAPRLRHWGAWELAARFSLLDLSDQTVQGGRMRDVTYGLNWYWTPDTRLMFNYIHSRVDDTPESGTVHVLQTRLQVEF